MAIINCPSCKKRISDKAKNCAHCGFDMVNQVSAEGNSVERLAQQEKLDRMKARNSLQMQAMTGIILFLLGVALWYFGGQGFSSLADYIEVGMIAIGGILYLLTRVRLILFKQKSN